MKDKDKKYLAGGLIGLFLVLWLGGFLAQWGIQSPITILAQQQAPPPEKTWSEIERENYENGIGMFEMSQTCYNSLAPATALTHNTNYDLFWYTKRGTTWTYHDTGGTVASPKYVDVTPEDGGYVYVSVEVISGQNFYVDADKIRATNSWIVDTLYTDIDDDTMNEFVFKFDMKGHSIPNSGYPGVTFHAHCFAYDNSFTGMVNLADLGNIGATKTTQWFRWYLTFSAVAKAVALTKVEFKTNITDTSKCQLNQIQIPGRGFLDDSALVMDELSTYYKWTYTYGNKYNTAYYLNCPTGTDYTQIDMDVKADFTLGTTNMTLTLTVWYLVNYAETTTTTTDSSAVTCK